MTLSDRTVRDTTQIGDTTVTRKTDKTDPSTEVALTMASDTQLRELTTFDDALRLIQEQLGAQVHSVEEHIGTGFVVLDDKAKLDGVDFLAVMWEFHSSGDYSSLTEDGDEVQGQFVSVHLMTRSPLQGYIGNKYIINDGSKGGVRDQLLDYTARNDGKKVGLYCAGGLTVSEYDYLDESTGKKSKARSYYLARG